MYTEELIDQFQSWGIPEEHYDIAAQMVEQFGEEYMGQWWEPMTEPYSQEKIGVWRKDLQDNLFFKAKNWYEMGDILIKIFDFETIDYTGIWEVDHLIERLCHKDLLAFYNLPDKSVLCTKGYKIKDSMIKTMNEGYEKWKKNEAFYANLRSS